MHKLIEMILSLLDAKIDLAHVRSAQSHDEAVGMEQLSAYWHSVVTEYTLETNTY